MSNEPTAIMPSSDGVQMMPESAALDPTAIAPVESAPPPEPAAREPSAGERFAALAKKERALLERERAIKEKEGGYSSYEKLKNDIKSDPIAYLESIGMSYADITDHILKGPVSPEALKMRELEEKIESFRREQEEAKTSQFERQREAQITNFKGEAATFLKNNLEKYESVDAAFDSHADAVDMVFEICRQYWKDTGGDQGGKALDFESAYNHLEEYCAKQLQPKVDRLAKTKKYGGRWASEQKSEQKNDPFGIMPKEVAPQTITSRAHTSSLGTTSGRRTSEAESLANAARLIKWE